MIPYVDECLNEWAAWLRSIPEHGGEPRKPGSCINPGSINAALSGGVEHVPNPERAEHMDRVIAIMPVMQKIAVIQKYYKSRGSDALASVSLGISPTTLKKRIDGAHHWIDGLITARKMMAVECEGTDF